jgi:hypothetical protein
MVLIAEQNLGMASPSAAWLQKKGPPVSVDLKIAETTVLDALRNSGFRQLVDPQIAEEKAASVGGLTTELTASQARRLGSLTHAEVIIVGQVVATSSGELDAADFGKGWFACAATLSGRAVNTDNGDILSTAETTQRPPPQRDELSCGKEAIKKAAAVFAREMTGKIGERWSKDVSGGNEVHLTVRKVSSFKQASDFRSALGQLVRGVKGVAQRSFSGSTQELDVTLVGSTEQLAAELEARKLGKFSVKVTGVSANTVDVELGN